MANKKRPRPVQGGTDSLEVVLVHRFNHMSIDSLDPEHLVLAIPMAVVKRDGKLAHLQKYHAKDCVSDSLWDWLEKMRGNCDRTDRELNTLDEDVEWCRYSFNITFGHDEHASDRSGDGSSESSESSE